MSDERDEFLQKCTAKKSRGTVLGFGFSVKAKPPLES
jgi:hypothetical protein